MDDFPGRTAAPLSTRFSPHRLAPTRPVLPGPTPPRPALRHSAAPPRAARPVVYTGFGFGGTLKDPGHALHEKGLQRRIGIGPLVSSQERRAAVVPRINCWSTAGFVLPSVYIGFCLLVLPKNVQDSCLRCLGGQEGRLFPGRNDSSASRPAPPCRAAPRRPAVRLPAPTRP